MNINQADQITIVAPDDWHIHLRDNDALALTVPHAARSFRRAIVMPNLVPPVTNAQEINEYRERILAHTPSASQFTPLMVLYLTDKTTPADIIAIKAAGAVACKLYPAGATTNSDSGVTALENIYPALEEMQKQGIKLLIHGEVTDSHIDIFEREARFVETLFASLVQRFPELDIVLEHITSSEAAEFVSSASRHIAATITAHHLLYNRNHMLAGGIRPHYYCLPILKHQRHQHALITAATSSRNKFFLGTDSAPHARSRKEAPCGCAGAYTAFTALELYAEVFERAGKIQQLEAFASLNGPRFYNLPVNAHSITLKKQTWTVPESFPYCGETIRPLCAGETLSWKLVDTQC